MQENFQTFETIDDECLEVLFRAFDTLFVGLTAVGKFTLISYQHASELRNILRGNFSQITLIYKLDHIFQVCPRPHSIILLTWYHSDLIPFV